MTPPSLPLHYARHTDTGRVREHNEDAYGTPDDLGVPPAQVAALGVLLVVADGMGGRAAGEDASRLAVRTLYERFYADPQPDRRAAMGLALAAANAAVKGAGEADLSKAGMGSTVVALVCHNNQAFVAHAGDSRAYRLRGGKLEPLTGDHTWVAESVAAGVITQAEAANHPYRHSLTRALGLEATVNPTLSEWFPLVAGDRFLLCSDGLTNEIKPSDLARWLAAGSAEQAAGQLVARARAAGGRDNITAVAAVVGDGGAVGGAVPAATGVGKSGTSRWLLAAAGILVGIVVIGAIASGLWKGGQEATPTAVVVAVVTPSPAPSLTPTSKPSSTVAPTWSPTPTPTNTPTKPPTPTPTPTRMPWEQLAALQISLDDPSRQALQAEDKYNTLCQDYHVGDLTCTIAPSALSLIVAGQLKAGSNFIEPAWAGQTTFERRDWPSTDSAGTRPQFSRNAQVAIVGKFPQWEPQLVLVASDGEKSQRCLFIYQTAQSNCVELGWASDLGWRIIASRHDGSSDLNVVLEAGHWDHAPPQSQSISRFRYVQFVPEPDLRFQLDRSSQTYRPIP